MIFSIAFLASLGRPTSTEIFLFSVDLFNLKITSAVSSAIINFAVKTFGSKGNGDGEFNYPDGVAVTSDNQIIVADRFFPSSKI